MISAHITFKVYLLSRPIYSFRWKPSRWISLKRWLWGWTGSILSLQPACRIRAPTSVRSTQANTPLWGSTIILQVTRYTTSEENELEVVIDIDYWEDIWNGTPKTTASQVLTDYAWYQMLHLNIIYVFHQVLEGMWRNLCQIILVTLTIIMIYNEYNDLVQILFIL